MSWEWTMVRQACGALVALTVLGLLLVGPMALAISAGAMGEVCVSDYRCDR